MTRHKTVQPANDNGIANGETLPLLLPLIDVLARQAVQMAKAANDNRQTGSSDLD